MTFIVIELQTNANGAVGNFVWAYTERSQAEQKYHTVLAAAAVSALPSHAAVMLTSEGQMVSHAVYHHAVEPEPEETGEE